MTAFDATGTLVGGQLPAVPAAMYGILVAGLSTLCSSELLLSPALAVTASVKSTVSLLASWSPPSVSAAASACMVGYRVSLAACSDAGGQGDCQTTTAWDSGGLPFEAVAAALPYLPLGSANLSRGLLPASVDTTSYLQYELTGLSTLKWYKVAVQAVDADGNPNYAPACTVAATCTTVQAPKRCA